MKKKRCESCGHMHKKRSDGKGWDCMKPKCNCGNFIIAGKRVG
jgi:hypothetical protein